MGNNPEENNKIFRLTLLEDRTHKKIRSIRFSRFQMIATLITTFVVLCLFVFAVISYTPIKTFIPGYPDVRSKNQAIENAIRIDSLESVIVRWELYAENLSRVLAGDPTISIDSLVNKNNSTKYLKDVNPEKIASQDSLISSKSVRK